MEWRYHERWATNKWLDSEGVRGSVRKSSCGARNTMNRFGLPISPKARAF